jgi:hypothetical protein
VVVFILSALLALVPGISVQAIAPTMTDALPTAAAAVASPVPTPTPGDQPVAHP